MIKVKKIGKDGLEHEYWQYTEEEIAEMKERAKERRQKLEEEKKQA